MLSALETIYILVSLGLLFFLVLPFINVLLSFFNKEKLILPESSRVYDFGLIITAYRNVEISKNLVSSLLKQSHQNFRIYLIADTCDISKWNIINEKLDILRPKEPLNLKAKSIIYAIEHFKRRHDFVVVFDADNLAHPEFLTEMNKYANCGYSTIQGQRTAKNLDSIYACADATGEFYKNYIERYVPYLIGSSAVISGSGMAVETELYKSYLDSPEIEKGKHLWKKMLQEDKILQNFILKRNERIVYAWNALVYDEKVTSSEAVETQRSRWLFSYFQNIPNSIEILRKGVVNFSWNQFLFGWITLAPPMFIQLFLAVVLAIIGLFLSPKMAMILVLGILIFIGNIFLSLYLSKVPKQIWKALWGIPVFVLNQVFALFKMGNPNKNFKHTEHHKHLTIDKVINRSGR